MNYYEIFGVGQNASDAEIKKAYRQLTLKYHPDRNKDPSAQQKYEQVKQAYEVLKDPQRRAGYDRHLREESENRQRQQKEKQHHQQQQENRQKHNTASGSSRYARRNYSHSSNTRTSAEQLKIVQDNTAALKSLLRSMGAEGKNLGQLYRSLDLPDDIVRDLKQVNYLHNQVVYDGVNLNNKDMVRFLHCAKRALSRLEIMRVNATRNSNSYKEESHAAQNADYNNASSYESPSTTPNNKLTKFDSILSSALILLRICVAIIGLYILFSSTNVYIESIASTLFLLIFLLGILISPEGVFIITIVIFILKEMINYIINHTNYEITLIVVLISWIFVELYSWNKK